MAAHPYASIKTKPRKRAVATSAAVRPVQVSQSLESSAMESVAPSSAELLACMGRAKHQRLAEMLRDLRIGAEALSANADGLLSRLS